MKTREEVKLSWCPKQKFKYHGWNANPEISLILIMLCGEFVWDQDGGLYLGLIQQTQMSKLRFFLLFFFLDFWTWLSKKQCSVVCSMVLARDPGTGQVVAVCCRAWSQKPACGVPCTGSRNPAACPLSPKWQWPPWATMTELHVLCYKNTDPRFREWCMGESSQHGCVLLHLLSHACLQPWGKGSLK